MMIGNEMKSEEKMNGNFRWEERNVIRVLPLPLKYCFKEIFQKKWGKIYAEDIQQNQRLMV